MSEREATDSADTEDSPDSVARLAADLREVRVGAGNPTFKALQAATRLSRTVLSEAFAGRRLPSPRTLEGILRACGQDAHPWLGRRDALAETAKVGGARTGSGSRDVPRRIAVLLAVGAFLVGSVASGVVTAVVLRGFPPPVANAARVAVATGTDPALTRCADDAVVAARETGADNAVLEIVWSDACQAGWGRITRYDGLTVGNAVTVSIYPETAPEGPDLQQTTVRSGRSASTALVLRPTADTRLCATGSFTVGGTSIDVGDRLCM